MDNFDPQNQLQNLRIMQNMRCSMDEMLALFDVIININDGTTNCSSTASDASINNSSKKNVFIFYTSPFY
jgi:hypothetical protein